MNQKPDSTAVTWRHTHPVDPDGFMQIGFETDGGEVIRLRISTACADHLVETVTAYRDPQGSNDSAG